MDPFRVSTTCVGLSYDGRHVWFASGDKLNAFDPASGKTLALDRGRRACGNGLRRPAQHCFRFAFAGIQKIYRMTGSVLATIPAPAAAADSGLAPSPGGRCGSGSIGDRKIHQIHPQTGAILRTIESNRFVTGVTWIDGELWHATLEGDESDLRRVDPRTGEVLGRFVMPPGASISGLESDGGDQFFCGGERSGKVRAVRRPNEPSRRAIAPRHKPDPKGKRSKRA